MIIYTGNLPGGFFHKAICLCTRKVDIWPIIHRLDLFISALVVLLNVLNIPANPLREKEVQSAQFGLGGQEDAPEQAIRVVTNIDEIETIPVFFDFPDEILVRRKF